MTRYEIINHYHTNYVTNDYLETNMVHYTSFYYKNEYGPIFEFTNCLVILSNNNLIIKDNKAPYYLFNMSNIKYIKIIFKGAKNE